MRNITKRVRVLAATVAIVVAGGVGVAAAANTAAPSSNAMQKGMGINEFGMTKSYFNGRHRQLHLLEGLLLRQAA